MNFDLLIMIIIFFFCLVVFVSCAFAQNSTAPDDNPCDNLCGDSTINRFWIKSLASNICYKVPNNCALVIANCRSPSSNFIVDTQGSCPNYS